jgi:hypothetical protein
VELGRRALDGRAFGVEFEGFGGGAVGLLPGVALAVVAQLGWLVGREGPERFAVVVEVGGGAVPVRACGRVVGPASEPVGDPVGLVAADVVDAALAGLFVAAVELELGRGELDQLVAVAVEPVLALTVVDVDLALQTPGFTLEGLGAVGPVGQCPLGVVALGPSEQPRERAQPVEAGVLFADALVRLVQLVAHAGQPLLAARGLDLADRSVAT